MKKNKMMRLASVLLVLTLLSTSVISGTFAKYTTSATSNDAARVAKWGFNNSASIDITDLFADTYDFTQAVGGTYYKVDSQNNEDVIAPGTTGTASFQFTYDNSDIATPEVAYTFSVDVEETCDDAIKANKNIKWYLDDANKTKALTWDELIAAIKNLSGDASGSKDYKPGELPTAFTASDDTHTITWEWLFEGTETYNVNGVSMSQDEYDTYMGNMAELDDVSIKITITATQKD